MSSPWNGAGEGNAPPPAPHAGVDGTPGVDDADSTPDGTNRASGAGARTGPAAPEWRRLSPRTLLVHCGWLGAPLGSLALAALATGGRISRGGWLTLAAIAGAFAVLTVAGLVRWARTDFRVTGESLDIRSGVLTRRQRSVPLHRIRTVDLTASPLHRLLGVTVLRAGTAGTGEGGGELSLEALTAAEGERLRTELLARAAAGAVAEDPVLARISWRWLRYAPLTFWVVGGVFAAGGSAYRVLDQIGIEPWKLGFVRRAFEEFGTGMLWLTIPAALLAVIALGSVGAVVLYVENWWNYRLEWADAGTLRVHRGLLTTRSVTIERARLRGVVLREPLLLRAGGGATVCAVASGLGDTEEQRKRSGLLPPAPRREAVRVAGGVLQSSFPDADVMGHQEWRLMRHPRAALRRRRMRGLLFAVVPGAALLAGCGVAFTPVLLHVAWVYAVVATPVVLWLARDAYRNLGHGIAGRHLVARSGTFSRDTLALRREAVAAWTFTTSPFTRRAGLVTLTAAVAAGEEGYRIPDLAEGAAPGFAAAAAPGILDEFLTHPVRPGDPAPAA